MMRADALCWHCGEELPATVVHARVAGESRSLCCHGCRAAAEWIEQLGLTDYYRLRTLPAQKPPLGEPADRGSNVAWQREEIARHVLRDLGDGRRETMLLPELRAHAADVQERLSSACGFDVPVRPVLVVLARQLSVKRQPEGVDVVGRHRIARWLREQPAVQSFETAAAIQFVARRADTWS